MILASRIVRHSLSIMGDLSTEQVSITYAGILKQSYDETVDVGGKTEKGDRRSSPSTEPS